MFENRKEFHVKMSVFRKENLSHFIERTGIDRPSRKNQKPSLQRSLRRTKSNLPDAAQKCKILYYSQHNKYTLITFKFDVLLFRMAIVGQNFMLSTSRFARGRRWNRHLSFSVSRSANSGTNLSFSTSRFALDN